MGPHVPIIQPRQPSAGGHSLSIHSPFTKLPDLITKACFLFSLPAPVHSFFPRVQLYTSSSWTGPHKQFSTTVKVRLRQLCPRSDITPLWDPHSCSFFTAREPEGQRDSFLVYLASNWQVLHLNSSKVPALSVAISCPALDFSPTLCMLCLIVLVLEMQRAALAPQENTIYHNSHPWLSSVTGPWSCVIWLNPTTLRSRSCYCPCLLLINCSPEAVS